MEEAVIETKTCKQCQTSFVITDKDMEFYDKLSPVLEGKKYLIPPPTLCPVCRHQRRLAWRNERTLYKRKCNFSGETIISMYHEDCPFPVYAADVWLSDQWDAKSYGQDFDFSKGFFEQFHLLQNRVPRQSLITEANENCPYVNLVGNSKNSYLIFGSTGCEDCMYGSPYESFACVDTLAIVNSQHCYECVDCEKLYDCMYCQNCNNSSNIIYGFGLEGCQDCLGCVGLVNMQYCIFNEQCTKEEYQKIIAATNLCNPVQIQKVKKRFEELKKITPRKYYIGQNNERVQGDYVYNSKNCYRIFNAQDAEDVKYATQLISAKTSMDVDYGEYAEGPLYENSGYFHIANALFCHRTWIEGDGMMYCSACRNVKNCFGCVNLNTAEYCVLNKQYTKEEYEQLVPKIIEHMQTTGEWGEFFPIAISPFGYNETIAYDHYPLTREKALDEGYQWQDKEYPINISDDMEKILAKDLPIDIADIEDDVLNKAIICEMTGKPFKIIKQELGFYRRHKLPLPHKHPDVRYRERMAMRTPKKLWDRTCMKCGTAIKTTYAPERPERIYCEACYNKTIY